jgi:hypothetical protein
VVAEGSYEKGHRIRMCESKRKKQEEGAEKQRRVKGKENWRKQRTLADPRSSLKDENQIKPDSDIAQVLFPFLTVKRVGH